MKRSDTFSCFNTKKVWINIYELKYSLSVSFCKARWTGLKPSGFSFLTNDDFNFMISIINSTFPFHQHVKEYQQKVSCWSNLSKYSDLFELVRTNHLYHHIQQLPSQRKLRKVENGNEFCVLKTDSEGANTNEVMEFTMINKSLRKLNRSNCALMGKRTNWCYGKQSILYEVAKI